MEGGESNRKKLKIEIEIEEISVVRQLPVDKIDINALPTTITLSPTTRNNNYIECTEFSNDIFEHLHLSQNKYACREDYLKTVQTNITANMLQVLMDWLVEVAQEYHLTDETLHLAKQYIDRYLCREKVTRDRLQLVGVCATLIACKYEEIFPPSVDDFIYISDNTFTREQVLEMENQILNSLDFNLCNPIPLEFLGRYIHLLSNSCNSLAIIKSLAKYFLELAFLNYEMRVFLPSYQALAALILSIFGVEEETNLRNFNLRGFDHAVLLECISVLHQEWSNAPKSKLQASRLKYERTRNHKVSELTLPPKLWKI